MMTVLQLKHENVSKFATCGSDLLPIIASLQSGQLRIVGRDGVDIRTTLQATALVTQKALAMRRAKITSVDIE